ncbi:apolipoprotein L2-like [Dipodomys merriami]|uniref:apolipoprotein L2-like n=1 Tax=Dipodomys merriami TaxID=94247 RepID=UPI003855D907
MHWVTSKPTRGRFCAWKTTMSARNIFRVTSAGVKNLATSPDARQFIGNVTDFLVDQLGPEYASLLVTEDQIWEVFVAAAGLSRDEAGALKKALKNDTADTVQQGQLQRKILQRFPRVKTEVEGYIRRLRALADEVSKVHRNCTISHVVADSTSVASEIMTLGGLALAPSTAGLSLGLSVGGMGLGAAASVTSAATSIVEGKNVSSAKDEVTKLLSVSTERLKELSEMVGCLSFKAVLASDEFIQCLRELGKHVHAFRQARANPQVLQQARGLMNTWRSSRGFESVERAFGGTALAMTRGARILGAVPTGVFLAMDVASLVQDSQHLSKGAESELATELRRVAQELENKLELLVKIHRKLSSGQAR